MLKTATRSAPERWVFGRYIVFAVNRYDARRIYETALLSALEGVRFGHIGLDDGGGGDWVLLPERQRINKA